MQHRIKGAGAKYCQAKTDQTLSDPISINPIEQLCYMHTPQLVTSQTTLRIIKPNHKITDYIHIHCSLGKSGTQVAELQEHPC